MATEYVISSGIKAVSVETVWVEAIPHIKDFDPALFPHQREVSMPEEWGGGGELTSSPGPLFQLFHVAHRKSWESGPGDEAWGE